MWPLPPPLLLLLLLLLLLPRACTSGVRQTPPVPPACRDAVMPSSPSPRAAPKPPVRRRLPPTACAIRVGALLLGTETAGDQPPAARSDAGLRKGNAGLKRTTLLCDRVHLRRPCPRRPVRSVNGVVSIAPRHHRHRSRNKVPSPDLHGSRVTRHHHHLHYHNFASNQATKHDTQESKLAPSQGERLL